MANDPSDARFSALLESAPDGMVIVDAAGTIVLVNAQAEALFGWPRAELLGKPVEMLIPHRFRDRHAGHRTRYHAHPQVRPMGAGLELWGLHRDGREFPVEISLSPLGAGGERLVTAAVRDVTAQREVHARMEASLAEKEVLLRELHHRVKNNLQIVSSLLNLQRGATHDAATRAILQDSRMRIQSLALVHERLHRSQDAGHLDLAAYLGDLVRELQRSYGRPTVAVEVDVEPLRVSLDLGVTLGLIVNELVSNAFKHAVGESGGHLRVAASRHGDRLALLVADDGPGLPPGFDPERSDSLGLQLVATLSRQLGGHARTGGPGTTWNVEVGL